MISSHKCWYTALLCSLFLSIGRPSYGQSIADTLQLQGVEVVATRIQQPLQLQPTHVQVIDSSQLSLQGGQNIGEMLNNLSTLFIKDNGPGGLATASQRGLSAEQMQVLWEGFSINSVMLGLSDLSLLPASLFSSVQVSSGNPSSAFGGGSLSGALYLSSRGKSSNDVSLRQGGGSYGQHQTALNAQYHADGWRVGVRSEVSAADNDFKFYNRAYDRTEHRTHNRQVQQNVIAHVGHTSGVKKVNTRFWILNSENDIPGSILATNNRAHQDDKALRWLSSYQTEWRGAAITAKSYLERAELNYYDPKIDTRSLSTSRHGVLRANISYPVSPQVEMKGAISGGLTGVETNNYTDLKTRQQFSARINPELSVVHQRLRLYPALRLDSYSDFGSVLSPSLGLNYQFIRDRLYLRGQLSRDFNPPTFNALYWAQGGDPTLQPERGNSAEAGLVVNPRFASFSTLTLTGYYNRVHNGIRWYPGDAGVYSPENVDEITSKGVEATLNNGIRLPARLQLQLNQSVHFTSAKITQPRFAGDGGVGHQLRYIPKWNYHASLSLIKGMFTGLVQYRWTSRRYYTDTENYNSSLDSYSVLNATLQLQKQFLGLNFTARGGVRNLLNTNYEIIQWYAMPQRNIHLSLTATYNF